LSANQYCAKRNATAMTTIRPKERPIFHRTAMKAP